MRLADAALAPCVKRRTSTPRAWSAV
jgi:hypothetical protein